jgi:hypothetical protein
MTPAAKNWGARGAGGGVRQRGARRLAGASSCCTGRQRRRGTDSTPPPRPPAPPAHRDGAQDLDVGVALAGVGRLLAHPRLQLLNVPHRARCCRRCCHACCALLPPPPAAAAVEGEARGGGRARGGRAARRGAGGKHRGAGGKRRSARRRRSAARRSGAARGGSGARQARPPCAGRCTALPPPQRTDNRVVPAATPDHAGPPSSRTWRVRALSSQIWRACPGVWRRVKLRGTPMGRAQDQTAGRGRPARRPAARRAAAAPRPLAGSSSAGPADKPSSRTAPQPPSPFAARKNRACSCVRRRGAPLAHPGLRPRQGRLRPHGCSNRRWLRVCDSDRAVPVVGLRHG